MRGLLVTTAGRQCTGAVFESSRGDPGYIVASS